MARKYVSNKDESLRIFRSDFLEWFTYVHPVVPHVLYTPIVAFVVSAAYAAGVAPGRIALLFVGGVAIWTLAEYVVHRFVFHTRPELEEEVRQIVAGLEPGEAALPKLGSFRQRHYFLAHGRVMLYLKKKHFRHHYQDSRRDFGVSSPLWDWILRTA